MVPETDRMPKKISWVGWLVTGMILAIILGLAYQGHDSGSEGDLSISTNAQETASGGCASELAYWTDLLVNTNLAPDTRHALYAEFGGLSPQAEIVSRAALDYIEDASTRGQDFANRQAASTLSSFCEAQGYRI